MTATTPPTLYSFRRCPYAMRARLALLSSGIRSEIREIVLRNKPTAMLAVSPKGTVPVLVCADGRVLEQSLDIMLWALEQSDSKKWLTPESGSLADMLTLIAECDGDFKFNLDRYKYPERYPDVIDPFCCRLSASEFLMSLEQRLGQSRYLYGSRPSLADMAIAPFVRQFAHTDKAWFASQPWPKLQIWLVEILESAIYETAMTRYAPWQEGQPVTWFPPQAENIAGTNVT
jgi:glutathione S-transferase